MITDFRAVRLQDPISVPVQHILAGFQADFPVLAGERVVGVLTREAVVRTLADSGSGSLVEDAVRREERTTFLSAMSAEPLSNAYGRLRESEQNTMVVLEHNELVGLLTSENVAELLMLKTALEHSASGSTATNG